jgi:hypothetical protein
MHIRALVGAALLALCTLAMTPVAMADPAPDICVLDLAQPVDFDQSIGTGDVTCSAIAVVELAAAVPISPGDEDEAAGPGLVKRLAALDLAIHRQHEDPGRVLV